MVNEEHQPYLVAAALAGAAALCCALPLLLSAGVATALAGLGLGNWLIVLLGAGLAVVGIGRIRRHGRRCD
jgi:hypothetical protein